MNWNKLATPKRPTFEEAQSIAKLQFDWHMGFMNDHSFICAMNIMFDCINLDGLNENNKTIDRRKQ